MSKPLHEESSTINVDTLSNSISNIVSALGGREITTTGSRYVLGDDALGCLQDLARWFKVINDDEKLMVSKAISTTTLGTIDLVEILTQWQLEEEKLDKAQSLKEKKNKDKVNINNQEHNEEDVAKTKGQEALRAKKARIALACLELLVPMTWPLSFNTISSPTELLLMPEIRYSQAKYKAAILGHPKKRVLKAIIRIAMPLLETPKPNRTPRQESIINLVFLFFRNLLQINYRDNAATEFGLDESSVLTDSISRNTEIRALYQQNVLDFLLVAASKCGDEFSSQTHIIMESLYYLLIGIRPIDIYPLDSAQKSHSLYKSLSQFSQPESSLLSALKRDKAINSRIMAKQSSRHSNFGTLVAVKMPNGMSRPIASNLLNSKNVVELLYGQNPNSGTGITPQKTTDGAFKINFDQLQDEKHLNSGFENGKSSGNRLKKQLEMLSSDTYEISVQLLSINQKVILRFLKKFFDISFNPMFKALRKMFEQEFDSISLEYQSQYLRLVSFFLESQHLKLLTESQKNENSENNNEDEGDKWGFYAVAEALTENNFIIMRKIMDNAFEGNHFAVLQSSMLCFQSLIRVVKEMASQGSSEVKELAENISLRLFREGRWLDVIAHIPRTANKQSWNYISTTVELSQLILTTLQKYAFNNEGLYVRGKASKRPKKKAASKDSEKVSEDNKDQENESADEYETNQYVLKEQQFDFLKFEKKFYHEDTISTYIAYLSRFQSMTESQLKLGFKLIMRFFSDNSMRVKFFRLDFFYLLYLMVDPQTYMDVSAAFRDFLSNFISYFMSQFALTCRSTPSILAEVPFEKQESYLPYLELGFEEYQLSQLTNEKEGKRKRSPPYAGKVASLLGFVEEQEFLLPYRNRLAVVVSAILDDGQKPLLEWALKNLENAYTQREKWEESLADLSDSEQTSIAPQIAFTVSDKEEYEEYSPEEKGILVALRKNNKLRLLLEMTGCQLLDSESKTLATLSSTAKLSELKESIMYIKQFLEDEVSLVMMFPEGKSAIDFLEVKRRKSQNKRKHPVTRKRANESGSEDDEEEEEEDRQFIDDDENSAYETDENGVQRKLQKSTHGRHKKRSKQKKRRRLQGSSTKSAPEKEQLVIKSSEFVSPSDDESDEERDKMIYEREALQIQKNAELFKFPAQKSGDSVATNKKQIDLSIFDDDDENVDDNNEDVLEYSNADSDEDSSNNQDENSNLDKDGNDDENVDANESENTNEDSNSKENGNAKANEKNNTSANSNKENSNKDASSKEQDKQNNNSKIASEEEKIKQAKIRELIEGLNRFAEITRRDMEEYDNYSDDDPGVAAELEMESILGIDSDYSDDYY